MSLNNVVSCGIVAMHCVVYHV